MPNPSLADFLETLHEAGELVRVEASVDPSLELPEIVSRTTQPGGPCLLFSSLSGSVIPVVASLLGSRRRIGHALGVTAPAEAAARVEALLGPSFAEGVAGGAAAPAKREIGAAATPRVVRSGPSQRVVLLDRDIDLGRLPALRCWPVETHPAITAAQLVSVDPTSGTRCVGRFDLDVVAADRLALRAAPHEPVVRLLEAYRRSGQPMPVAAVLGGDPAMLLAAMAPLPAWLDAWGMAGVLRGRPVELVAGRRVKLDVPADAELVIEGAINPTDPPEELGPRVTPTGHVAAPGPAPVVRVAAVTHRANPVFPAMVHGPAAGEWVTLTRSLWEVFLPLVRRAVPEVVDLDLSPHGSARHVAFVSIHKTHAGQARRVASALWGLPSLMFAKLLVVVDEDVDVREEPQVWAAVSRRANPARDVVLQQGPPDPWDPAGEPGELGQRMAIDATTKVAGEHLVISARPAEMSEAIRQLVTARWGEYGLSTSRRT